MLPLLLGNKARAAAPSRATPDDDRKDASRACILPRVALSSCPPLLPKAVTATAHNRRRTYRNPVCAAGLFCLMLAAFIVFAVSDSTTLAGKDVVSKTINAASKSSSRTGEALSKTIKAAAKSSTRTREALSIFSPLSMSSLAAVSSSPASSSSSSSSSSRHRHQSPQRLLRRRPPPSTSAAVVSASLSLAALPGSSSRPDSEFPPAVPRSPLLSTAELLTLQHYARGSSYVEWGSGASTLLAAPMARRSVSIENQRGWCDEMLASSDGDFWISNGVLTYLCVDTGPTGELGWPTAEANPEHFRRYLSALDDAVDALAAEEEAEKEAEVEIEAAEEAGAETEEAETEVASALSFFFSSMARFFRAPGSDRGKASTVSITTSAKSNNIYDNDNDNDSSSPSTTSTATTAITTTRTSSTNAFTVVLVDGRFRVACALKALWHIDHSLGVLLVHDWTLRKEQYHAPILKRYRLVTVIDRLALLVPSSPPEVVSASGDGGDGGGRYGDGKDRGEQARVRWWSEAAAELERYSRDPT